MKNVFISVLLAVIFVSCEKLPDLPDTNYTLGGGVFIVNEGNFRGGNGSLSFYSFDSLKIYNDIFSSKNGRPLGDVPNSMIIKEDKAYIVVNNSGKIEVIDPMTFESKATIQGLISPRNITVINSAKAYVSSIYSDSVAIINLTDNNISGYINLKRSSEAIILNGNRAFISNWMGGNKIMVINTLIDQVVDSIEVGMEPESMVLDKNFKLWVLCNGGWTRQNYAELIGINTSTNMIEKKFIFSTKQASPTSLQIDGLGTSLYYLDNGVRQMSINSESLPLSPIIPQSGEYFYKLAINPFNGDILITDAVDFMQSGYLIFYNKKAEFVSKNKADIIPGAMCFKIRY